MLGVFVCVCMRPLGYGPNIVPHGHATDGLSSPRQLFRAVLYAVALRLLMTVVKIRCKQLAHYDLRGSIESEVWWYFYCGSDAQWK